MSLEKIYGVHAVEALLRHHPKRVKQVWLAEGRSEPRVQALVELATAKHGCRSARPSVVKWTSGSKAFTRVWSRT